MRSRAPDQCAAGLLTLRAWRVLEAAERLNPVAAGARGGQFYNTLAMSAEILGTSPIELSGVPATAPNKAEATRAAGRMLMEAVRANRALRTIITRKSLENTIASVAQAADRRMPCCICLPLLRRWVSSSTLKTSTRSQNALLDAPDARGPIPGLELPGGGRFSIKLAKRMIDGHADGSAQT